MSLNPLRNDYVRPSEGGDWSCLAATLNRYLVRMFVDLNFGPQENYPSIVLQVTEPEDLKALADALTPFIDRGLQVEQAAILDRFGLAAPTEGAQLLKPKDAQAPAAVPALNSQQPCACPACGGQRTALNAEQPRDALDMLASEALDDWEPLLQPVLDPVRQLAEQSGSFEDFRAGLAGLLDQMDDSRLIEQLARAAYKARGLGDGSDQL